MDNKLYSKIFGWLFVGLLITFLGGYGFMAILVNNLNIAKAVLTSGFLIGIVISEIVIAIILGVRVAKLKPTTIKVLYILYCVLSSITFSTIFIAFKVSSIILVFLVTAIIFGLFALIGAKLNVDLKKFGTYLLIALIGIVIMSIINIIMQKTTLELVLAIISILVFTLYIGYDIKKAQALADSGIEEDNLAVYTAFQLYLDFINIFIRLLELFNRRD